MSRRTEPGLEVGSLGGSGGGCSAIFIKISSLHCTGLDCDHDEEPVEQVSSVFLSSYSRQSNKNREDRKVCFEKTR